MALYSDTRGVHTSALRESMLESQLWKNIRQKSVYDKELKDLLDQVKFFYFMKYDSAEYTKMRENI